MGFILVLEGRCNIQRSARCDAVTVKSLSHRLLSSVSARVPSHLKRSLQYIHIHSITGHKGPEGEKRCSSTLSPTSNLDENWWSTPRPYCFSPVEILRYPLNIWVPEPAFTVLSLFHCNSWGRKFEPTGLRNTSTAARWHSEIRQAMYV